MVHEVKPKMPERGMPWNSLHSVSDEGMMNTPPVKPVTPPVQAAPEMMKAPMQTVPEMMKAPMQTAPEMMKAPMQTAPEMMKAPMQTAPEMMKAPMQMEPEMMKAPMMHEMMEEPMMHNMPPMAMEHEMPMTGMMPMTGSMPMMPMVSAQFSFQMMYPVVYYRALPYIMMACDEMEMNGNVMPTQDVVDNTTGRIYDEMVRMYPDLEENGTMQQDEPSVPAQRSGMYYRDYDRYDRDRYDRDRYDRDHHDRHRGNLGNLLQILLLSELFRRRRRY